LDKEQSAASRSRAETQRLEALGEMAGGIVHDLRNLLAVIDTGVRLANEHAEQPENVRSYLSVTREAIVRGVRLTSHLLGFAQQTSPDKREENINELLTNLEPFLRYAAGPGVQVILDLRAQGPHCSVNRTQFEVAILNLVTNARDAMPGGGQIRIETDARIVGTDHSKLAPGQYIHVGVKDSGKGMSAEVVRRVFDPFFTTKGDRGTGMGLPQVFAFTQRVGGTIEVNSEPGHGTIIELFLPGIPH
jgi:signal transduction histidine kinase